MNPNLEDEIHIQIEAGHPVSFISEWIYEKMQSSEFEWTDQNLNSFFQFLFKSARWDLFFLFYQKNYKSEIWKNRWNSVVFGVLKNFPEMPQTLIDIFTRGYVEEPDLFLESLVLKNSYKLIPANQNSQSVKEIKKQLKIKAQNKINKIKSDLVQKFLFFQSQQLTEPAKELIKKLEKAFPLDQEIKDISRKFKETDAIDIFEKYKFKKRSYNYKAIMALDVLAVKNNLEKSILEQVVNLKSPEEVENLIILCFFIECESCALEILKLTKIEINDWIKLEVLVRNNLNLEVLNFLPTLEINYASIPDTFFACTYSRAQALWNLGEKNSAIEVLQSLIDAYPNYRNAAVLMQEWNGT